MASNGNGMSSVELPAPDMAEPEQESTGRSGFVHQDANLLPIPDRSTDKMIDELLLPIPDRFTDQLIDELWLRHRRFNNLSNLGRPGAPPRFVDMIKAALDFPFNKNEDAASFDEGLEQVD